MVKMVPGDTNTLGLTATQRAGGSARPGLPPHLINPIQLLAKIRITPEAPRLSARTTVVTQLVMDQASGAIPLTRTRDGSYATFHHAQIIASKAMVKGLLGDTNILGLTATQRPAENVSPGVPPAHINPAKPLAKIRITLPAAVMPARTTVVTQLVMEKASGAIPLTQIRDGSYATYHHAKMSRWKRSPQSTWNTNIDYQ